VHSHREQMRTLLPLLLIGCGGSKSHHTEPVAPRKIVMTVEVVAPAPAPAPTPAPAPDYAPVAAELFGEGFRSVELRAATVIRKAPDAESDKVGVIRKGTRAGVQRAEEGGRGCAKGRWLQLAPRGWICEAAIAPSREAATEATRISLTDEVGELPLPVGDLYGVVRGKDVSAYATAKDAGAGENGRTLVGSHTVRSAGKVTVDGKSFWRTSQGDLIDESSIAVIGPSQFKGRALAERAPLPAWVRAQKDPRKPATTRATPDAKGEAIGTLAARTIVSILEESADGKFVRIDDRAWIARADLRVATTASPPPGLEDGEKWFDVDLDEQVLVAYEGERPVYATLVSTGAWNHATPTRMARINSKFQATHMISTQREKYSVADVPWTMFYDGNYAVHTSYWHDNFGGTRSHGCINLSPRDAHLLYQWSSPDIPPGWTAVFGDEDHPGSLVRVRSKASPEPELHGYARKLHDRRTMVAAR
jgi:lipoprotein-anchoring transpeptidase ErfK/SrfK